MQNVLIIHSNGKSLGSTSIRWDADYAGLPERNDIEKFQYETIIQALAYGWKLLAKPEYFIPMGPDPGYWSWWLVREDD